MSKVSFAATPLIAAQISLVEREDLKRSGQKKDAPVKERRAGNAIAGGVNESNNSRSQGSCQLLPSSAEGAK